MTILVIDDHALFRQSLVHMLQERLPEAHYLQCGSQNEALALLHQAPELLLLDLNLGTGSGLSALEEIRKTLPSIRTLVVSIHRDGYHVAQALKARVQGFVTKDETVETLLEAVHAVLKGRTWFSQALADEASRFITLPGVNTDHRALDDFSDYRNLTLREQEIFLRLAEGKSVVEIAREFNRSSKTVENHRSAVYHKLGLSDRYELFAFAKKLGLIP